MLPLLMGVRFKVFILSIPLLLLFSSGVLLRSTKTVSNVSSELGNGCVADDLSGLPLANAKDAFFEGKALPVPIALLAQNNNQTQVLGVADPSDRWIEVDLSEQKLRAWDGNSLFLETAISSGLPGTPTPRGEFRVWVKLRAGKMEGGQGRYYYNLPNVPYIMYFENKDIPGWKGYGIHGAYWHNDFGRPHIHGCVNVPVSTAEKLYYWATPVLPETKTSVYAGPDNPGIRIVIHE